MCVCLPLGRIGRRVSTGFGQSTINFLFGKTAECRIKARTRRERAECNGLSLSQFCSIFLNFSIYPEFLILLFDVGLGSNGPTGRWSTLRV